MAPREAVDASWSGVRHRNCDFESDSEYLRRSSSRIRRRRYGVQLHKVSTVLIGAAVGDALEGSSFISKVSWDLGKIVFPLNLLRLALGCHMRSLIPFLSNHQLAG